MNLKTGPMGTLISQLILFLVCVGAPAAVTGLVPSTWIKFQRQGGQVNAHADVCVFFIIPYRRLDVSSVTSVDERTTNGRSYTVRRSSGKTEHHNEETKGFMAIHGADQQVEVQVTPHNLESVIEQVESFLKDSSATELKLFVTANWKFGVIGGGLLTLLTVLYVVGMLASLVMFLGRLAGIGRRSR